MLSLGKIAAGPNAARYYVDQVARDRGDYYAGEGEAPGTWTGSGARSLCLLGEVNGGRFAELLKGAGLRRPPSEGAVAGFDLTFRAPKSVSVLWAVAPANVAAELRSGHDAAVGEALGYLERRACRARRGAGGVVQVRGGGFVGAAFAHRASRAAAILAWSATKPLRPIRSSRGSSASLDAAAPKSSRVTGCPRSVSRL
jgi:conjugative relaxase-like TrwC/TraI family protein